MLNLDVVGQTFESTGHRWVNKDVMLYALAVGASQDDASSELEFTTENTEGKPLRVLPTFGAVIGQQSSRRPSLGAIKPGMALHGEQAITLHRPIPPEGTSRTVSTVRNIYDKGSGALVISESEVFSTDSDDPLVTSRSAVFIRGEGGFGGDRGSSSTWEAPNRAPDMEVSYTTRAEQALLYRLTGDRNPLHSDPALARRLGNEIPILHGMCTYGFTGRALLHSLCDSDPRRFVSMAGRFAAPVTPGGTLTVRIWAEGGTAQFQTVRDDGVVVIDHGNCCYRLAAEAGDR